MALKLAVAVVVEMEGTQVVVVVETYQDVEKGVEVVVAAIEAETCMCHPLLSASYDEMSDVLLPEKRSSHWLVKIKHQ